ncbi:OmpA family protein [Fulvimonas soli]|uniref:Peptidoglycan-associated lipoprotein n=1 Tax=Fulvimonas soli TaxID=155197 RepID=A0A316HV78_9GAMM|nr:OmpA family protein [Fulvimonas soli]PWK84324.1 peptidoglycan-associated lipoprotein [Fulvimonas soli]TNY25650.1 hypothetical protein BV497_12800 [Fulvimonas soli]
MTLHVPRTAALAAALLAVGLAGCSSYVKRTDFDAAIQQLQQKQQDQQQQIDAIKQQMQEQFSKYDAQITSLQGRVSVDTVAHFDFNSSTLREQDKPALQNFAQTLAKYHPDVLVTVEGFADPAGPAGYNQRLGMERARAVRDFLVSSGLSADKVRAVSYGEARNRQVAKGAVRENGADNRRVSLTVDSVGAGAASASS